MNKSESIANLTKALVEVQKVMEFAKKDSDNPFFKSKYADLAECWDTCRKPLTDNGLAIIQTCNPVQGGVEVETMLTHISGEWVTGTVLMPLVKLDPQSVGSAITYGRRYSLSAMVGIVSDDDDDAESAMGRGATAKKQEQSQQNDAQLRAVLQSHIDAVIDIDTAWAARTAVSKQTPFGSPIQKWAWGALMEKVREIGMDYDKASKAFVYRGDK